MSPPLVAIVVLNWNGLSDTRECVRSVLAQSHPRAELWVVDNASSHCEADALERDFAGRVVLLRSAENLGFAGGCNKALERILAAGRAEYVGLLNNDASADPLWIEALVTALEATPEAGSAASKMVLFDEPDLIENTGILVLSNGDAVPRGRGEPAARWSTPGTVVGPCGGAALWRADVLREIGLFRADFFANFEDVDLALRARARGHDCVYVPSAVVRHKLSVSVKRARDDAFDARALRNLSWAYCANMPWQVIVLNLPWLVVCNLVVILLAPLFGQMRVARLSIRGRAMAYRERADIRRARQELAPVRKGSWLALWLMQRSFVRSYVRFFWEGVVLRQRKFMQ